MTATKDFEFEHLDLLKKQLIKEIINFREVLDESLQQLEQDFQPTSEHGDFFDYTLKSVQCAEYEYREALTKYRLTLERCHGLPSY